MFIEHPLLACGLLKSKKKSMHSIGCLMSTFSCFVRSHEKLKPHPNEFQTLKLKTFEIQESKKRPAFFAGKEAQNFLLHNNQVT